MPYTTTTAEALDFAATIEGDRVDLAELEALHRQAFATEQGWRELRRLGEKFADSPLSGPSVGKRAKRAWVLWVLGRPKDAIAEVEDKAAAQDPVGALVLGRSFLELGDPKKARDAFEAGQKKAKDTKDTRDDFLLAMGIVEARREAGDADEALKAAEKLEKKFPDEAELHFQIGASHEALGDYATAMDRFEEAIERDPYHARALFRLAYNHELRGSDGVALEYYERCVTTVPAYTNALVNLGLLYEDRGDHEKAIDVYHKVLRVRPNHLRARMFLKDAEASLDMFYDEDQEKKSDRRKAILRIPVTDFELSVRSRNCLNKMNIRNLGDLVTKTETELLAYKNFGETSLQEIKQMLAQKSLRLGMGREEEIPVGPLGAPGMPAGLGTELGDEGVVDEGAASRTEREKVLQKPITELELSVRSRNCMERLNIRTVGELVSRSEQDLLGVKNFGQTSLNEIKQRLGELDLSLRQESVALGGPAGPSGPGAAGGLPGPGLGRTGGPLSPLDRLL